MYAIRSYYAGHVIAIGEDVKNIKVGDRIVSHGNMSCRICKACTQGREYDCRSRKIWGFETGPLWGRITSYNVCYTKLLRMFFSIRILLCLSGHFFA